MVECVESIALLVAGQLSQCEWGGFGGRKGKDVGVANDQP